MARIKRAVAAKKKRRTVMHRAKGYYGAASRTYKHAKEQVQHYVASGEPMDKAGAYGIQGTGGRMLVHDISGDFYNVVGLPIARVARAIQKLS